MVDCEKEMQKTQNLYKEIRGSDPTLASHKRAQMLKEEFDIAKNPLATKLQKVRSLRSQCNNKVGIIERALVEVQSLLQTTISADKGSSDERIFGDDRLSNITQHLAYNAAQILADIDAEIAHWQQKLLALHQSHNQDLLFVNKDITAQAWRQTKDQHNLMQICNSMRKLEVFGAKSKGEVDFEWPKMEDLQGIVDQLNPASLEIDAIEWAKPSGLGCFKLHYKGGFESPYFAHKETDVTDKGTLEVTRTELHIPYDEGVAIKSVRAKVLCEKWVNQIEFVAEGPHGQAIAQIGSDSEIKQTQERQLKEGERIIGLYGVKDKKACYSSIGFIVWTPRKAV